MGGFLFFYFVCYLIGVLRCFLMRVMFLFEFVEWVSFLIYWWFSLGVFGFWKMKCSGIDGCSYSVECLGVLLLGCCYDSVKFLF